MGCLALVTVPHIYSTTRRQTPYPPSSCTPPLYINISNDPMAAHEANHHEKRKSFRTGDPANSGLSKMQLRIGQSILASAVERVPTNFKKYERPCFRFSRNLGRNRAMPRT